MHSRVWGSGFVDLGLKTWGFRDRGWDFGYESLGL